MPPIICHGMFAYTEQRFAHISRGRHMLSRLVPGPRHGCLSCRSSYIIIVLIVVVVVVVFVFVFVFVDVHYLQ